MQLYDSRIQTEGALMPRAFTDKASSIWSRADNLKLYMVS